nr:MAG TPA: hypothetical protein [Caudoviricetes sp.]
MFLSCFRALKCPIFTHNYLFQPVKFLSKRYPPSRS